ncbi:MAG: hypothetical protein IPG16_02575 [Comamonadaceae bacterium]|nr:hypothetical protein [Comamonadaceae bacterium]
MTAHEPTPTAEHTDAVARVVAGLLDDFDTVMNVRAESREVARRLLTSTDPAVHLALVDALVRAGVLTERFAIRDEDGSVWLTVHRASARKSDATNLAPTAKACIDGLVDAGWLPDDDDQHVIATTFVAGEPLRPACLTLTITEQGDPT